MIKAHFTKGVEDVFATCDWKKVDCSIKKSDGEYVFKMDQVEAPAHLSQMACDIIAQKYFRRKGVPAETRPLTDNEHIPGWLALKEPVPGTTFGGETSLKQVYHRLAGAWTWHGFLTGHFDKEEAKVFYNEVLWCLLYQIAAPATPQWLNTGLGWAYGITGEQKGMFYFNHKTGKVLPCKDRYTRPGIMACHIQSLSDNILNKDGIMDLLTREAKVFVAGGGSGINASEIRGKGEPISHGGTSSGLISFLNVLDSSSGAIKSGGTSRRSARLVCLNDDHPDIEEFITWKKREEEKVACMLVGSKVIRDFLKDIKRPHEDVPYYLEDVFSTARELGVPEEIVHKADILEDWQIDEILSGYEDEAYRTVGGQNANNSIRISDKFMQAVEKNEKWDLYWRTDKTKPCKTFDDANELWDAIADAAWHSADPGLQFDDVINAWHTCKESGKIKSSNPCCLTGDTLIVTSDGWKRIDELTKDKFFVLCEDFEYREVEPSFSKGIKPVYRLTTFNNLTIDLTDDHRVIRIIPETYAFEDVMVKNLAVGDMLLVAGDYQDQNNISFVRMNSKFKSLEYIGDKEVFDITEPVTNHFVANRFVVHNSEYLFLDNNSCNLACINQAKFLKFHVDNGSHTFKTQDYLHVVSLWTRILDISVDMASYPSEEIALNAYKYRTLGLGYTNLGASLMRLGLAYDSKQANLVAATLTALMHFQSWKTSTEIAAQLGSFPEYEKNKVHVQRVLDKHIDAWGGISDNDNPGVSYYSILKSYAQEEGSLGLERHVDNFDDIVCDLDRIIAELNTSKNRKPVRNAQLTLLMPSGTVSFALDADTTGVEPDFSLIKHKKLSGGGNLTIINESVGPALYSLGYKPKEVATILDYLSKNGHLEGSTLKSEHLAVFDTADITASRSISLDGHINMLAAIAPYISGSASKTLNCPHDCTKEEIKEAYRKCYYKGIKCVSVYRDGCKLSQPLSSGSKKTKPQPVSGYRCETEKKTEEKQEEYTLEADSDPTFDLPPAVCDFATEADDLTQVYEGQEDWFEGSVEDLPQVPKIPRAKLPNRRNGYVQKAKIGGHTLYIRTGEYDDGRLGEIFLDFAKDGDFSQAMLSSFAISVSIGLQYGVPLEEYIEAFTHMSFAPNGPVMGDDRIKMCSSILDYIFRNLAVSYAGRSDLSHVQEEEVKKVDKVVRAVDDEDLEYEPVVVEYTSVAVSGTPCRECGQLTLRRTGSCLTCSSCGFNSGCG